MPRVCTVCTHPERPTVDAALVAGEPFRYVSERFGTSPAALFRHKAEHLPAELTKAREAEQVAHADDLLGQVQALRDHALRILGKAEAAGDFRSAVGAIREARSCVELLGELLHELERRPTVNILVAPEWLAVRSALLEALRPFPEARAAVSERLLALNGTER